MIHEGIGCLYFPTTIVFIDDDKKFLNSMALKMGRERVFRSFQDPEKALHFFNNEYHFNPFTNRCIEEIIDQPADERSMKINIRNIKHEIQNPHRFDEISIVILDYAVPGMNGGQLAQSLKNFPFKIVLLTGEADAKVAIELFNNGIIHNYLRKDDAQFVSILNSTILNLQHAYFHDLSVDILHSLAHSVDFKHAWFNDAIFIALVDSLFIKHSIVEYYLVDEKGSLLLLDKVGKPSWLAVTTTEEMASYYELASDGDAPKEVVDALKNKTMIPFFFTERDFQTPPAQWKPYLHPAQTLPGKETYYYAYITDPKAYKLDGKVFSYEEFLNAQK